VRKHVEQEDEDDPDAMNSPVAYYDSNISISERLKSAERAKATLKKMAKVHSMSEPILRRSRTSSIDRPLLSGLKYASQS
jgi:hypothetical protein